MGDASISLHAEGERVVLVKEDGTREVVDLGAPGKRGEPEVQDGLPEPVSQNAAPADVCGTDETADEPPVPGRSPLDGLVSRLRQGLEGEEPSEDEPRDSDDDDIDDTDGDDDDGAAGCVPVGGVS